MQRPGGGGRPDLPGITVLGDGEAVPNALRGAVAAIGNFDGVHRGHQALIARAAGLARDRGAVTAAITFEPHPRDFFRPDEPGFRLSSPERKLDLLGRHGVRLAVVLRFDATLAGTSAAGFVGERLARDIALSHVVVGEDFHFGRGREGTPAVLQRLGADVGLGVTLLPPVAADGAPISSSRVRDALESGDVALANRLLGYRWLVDGSVEHGAKRGRTLGYPTANIRPPRGCRLAHGIYAVRVGTPLGIRGGVASFGSRPTFDDGPPLLEVHLFDVAADLYGAALATEFVAFLRPEQRFDGADALVRQMDEDSRQARAALEALDPAGPSLLDPAAP